MILISSKDLSRRGGDQLYKTTKSFKGKTYHERLMKMIKRHRWKDNGEETKAHMHQNHANNSRCNTSTLCCIDDVYRYQQHKTEDEPFCKNQ